jgi:NADPH:quinone reductase-like Zn-dependent oxidoreductase
VIHPIPEEITMQSLELRHPWGTANLRVVEQPDPVPGPGEVLLRMRTASLNYRDSFIAAMGGYSPNGSAREPVIPLSDGCGIVEAIGPGVTRVAIGDRVAPSFFPNWISGPPTPEKAAGALGAPGGPGVGRELMTIDAEGVSKVPDFLTDEEVATLPCAALTAWRAMFVDADLKPGDSVVLQGTGGVSILGLQLARAAGLRTIITSSSDDKLERARALGADHLINYRTTPEWSQAVRQATGGRGADFVMEVAGADTLTESLKSIRLGGHISIIGVVSNPVSPGPVLSIGLMMGASARMQALMVGSRENFEAMCRMIELHRIRPVVDKLYPWTKAASAIAAMGTGAHFGKIVLQF